jgi:endonuclease III
MTKVTNQSVAEPLDKRVEKIVTELKQVYPNATYELDWDTPLQLMVGTILAAQCTDERVNKVTKTLFPKYPNATAFADADLLELEEDLKPTGFYRKKAETVKSVCQALVDRFDGNVPQTMAEMVALPGIARKTANVILNCAFNIPAGVIVDTHVFRVSQRVGLSAQKTPDKTEQDLMNIIPQDEWVFFGPAMVLHGRYTCTAKHPNYNECVIASVCEQNI